MAFAGPSYRRSGSSTPPRCSRGCSAGECRRGCSRRCRERRGLCYAIYSSCWALADTGLFGDPCGDRAGDDGEADRRRRRGAECVRRPRAPSEAELARSKAQIKAGMLMGLESSSARAEQMARQLLLFDRLIDAGGAGGAHRCGDAETPCRRWRRGSSAVRRPRSRWSGPGARARRTRAWWPSASGVSRHMQVCCERMAGGAEDSGDGG